MSVKNNKKKIKKNVKKNIKKKINRKKKKSFFKKHKLILILGFSVIILIGLFLYLLVPRYLKKEFLEKVEVSYNSEFNYEYGKVVYGNIFKNSEVKPEIIGTIDTSKIGIYTVRYVFKNNGQSFEFTQEVDVVDKKAPEIIIEKDVEVCPNGNLINANIKAIDEYDGDLTDNVESKLEGNILHISVKDSSGNVENKKVAAKIIDYEAPTITLNGKNDIVLKVGESYKEESAIAKDVCDGDLDINISGEVNTKKEGNYKIVYTAKNSAGKEAKIERNVKVISSRKASNPKKLVGAKVIYLTFDDGPSKHTGRLLDILKKYNVKATFFVTGYGSDAMIKREYDEGHTIGLHTYTHKYCDIYKSVDAYFADLNRIQNRVKRITGFTPKYIRFPGGSSNTVSRGCDNGKKIMSQLVKEVEKRGYVYFDWNVVSGDAGWTTSTDKVYNYVVNYLKSNYSIVLQHDSKGYSVDAVERIIKYGLANGFTFKAIDDSTPVVHHRVSN